MLDTPHSFSPHWHVVAAYLVFYAFGWGLYEQREALPRMQRFGVKEMAAGATLMIPYMTLIGLQLAQRGTRIWPAFLMTALLSGLIAWLMIYGLIGLCLRHFSAASERVRYFSDAAYWVYLAHPPVLVALQIPMMSLPVSPWIKFAFGIAAAFPILLWSYDRLVRDTWVGLALNGKRQPRWQSQRASVSREPEFVAERDSAAS